MADEKETPAAKRVPMLKMFLDAASSLVKTLSAPAPSGCGQCSSCPHLDSVKEEEERAEAAGRPRPVPQKCPSAQG